MHKLEIEVGKRIRRLREYHNMTQIQLSEALFVRQQNISKYEKGEVAIPIDVLIRVAEFFQISTDYLLNIEPKDDKPGSELEKYYQCMHPKEKSLILKIAKVIVEDNE